MNQYILLAKQTDENFIKEEESISPSKDLPKEFSRSELAELLKRKAGTFVTIEKNGELRGCIGTYLPTKENIAQEIIHNAIAAATEDYRFGSIQKEELPELSYTVYILNPPELVKDVKELDQKKFGIIVKSRGFAEGRDVIFNTAPKSYQKTGLLLPDLEGVDTVEQQIWIACQKGGIDPKNEEIIIYKFSVEKYEE